MWPWLFKILGGGVVESISGIVGKVWGNREKVQDAIANEQIAAQQSLSAEYQYRGERYWFDALADGLNRLPRPLIALAICALMAWAPIDPYSFAKAMDAYALVPEWLALVFGQIVAMYFGGRMLDKWQAGKMSGVSAAAVKQFVENSKQIDALVTQTALKKPAPKPRVVTEDGFAVADEVLDTKPMSDDKFQEVMADESVPMTNQAIAEWNRRRQMKGK
jgi:hypothetical protein